MIHRLDAHEDQAGAWDVLKNAHGRLAWDVGANIGQSTQVLAKNFETVIAFEPCEESASILIAETPSNVRVVKAAVSDVEGVIQLEEAERSIRTGQLVTGVGLPIWGDRIGLRTVPSITLDSRADERPDFVKIDTENHEIQVVRGGMRIFNSEERPKVIIEVHQESNEAVLRELMPKYTFIKLTHGDYVRQGGVIHRNHFWLVDERAACG